MAAAKSVNTLRGPHGPWTRVQWAVKLSAQITGKQIKRGPGYSLAVGSSLSTVSVDRGEEGVAGAP